MKKEFTIKLNMIEDLKNFVHEITYKIASDVYASYDRQTIDAKSIIGLITVCINPIKVEICSDNTEEIECFKQICERYEVK